MKPGSVEGKRVKLSIRYREIVFEFRLFCFLLFLVHQPLSTDPLPLIGWIAPDGDQPKKLHFARSYIPIFFCLLVNNSIDGSFQFTRR
jgi:hypothetical protein